MKPKNSIRAWALAGTALATSVSVASAAQAQETQTTRVEEVVVTAQKREQRLQDVPISISVMSQEAVEAAKITRMSDIGNVVPGVLGRAISGGSSAAQFLIRGSFGAAVAAGSDPSVAYAMDGVFIVASSGNDFDLPNISRLEVLKGPQGTLYGRNATAGVVSVTTANPTEEFDLVQKVTVGNYSQFVSKTTLNTGAFGPFSALLSYVHNERRGDVRNLGAGTVWNYGVSGQGTQTSPKRLGDRNINGVFGALKFEPSDTFNTVYKFDWSKNNGTPGASGQLGISPAVATLISTSTGIPAATIAAQTLRRPDAINNAYHTKLYMKAYGHNLTSTWQVADNITLKNIAGYRNHYQWNSYQFDGLGGLATTAANRLGVPAGVPVLVFVNNTYTSTKQWSDEVQLNADTELANITAGLIYFHTTSNKGSPPGSRLANLNGFLLGSPLAPGFAIQPGAGTTTFTKQTSLGAYAQAEVHVTDQIDVVGGIRLTEDKKIGRLETTTATANILRYPDYKKTLPSYEIGLNYKPSVDVMLYGKFAHSFVAGGINGPVEFQPEKADSFEVGIKSDWLDGRLRANLSAYTVKYSNIQSAGSGQLFCVDGTFASPTATCTRLTVGTVVTDQGDARVKGFEADTTIVVADGLTLSGNLVHTDFKYTRLSVVGLSSGILDGTRPKWAAGVSARYESQPLFKDTRLVLSADANYKSSFWIAFQASARAYAPGAKLPSAWLANARAELTDIDVAGHQINVAAWVRNIGDNKNPVAGGVAGNTVAEFQAARTVGLDLTFDF